MPKLGLSTKLWYGLGQGAEGIKNAAFTVLLFFFYSQVLGLSGILTGIALFIALAFDAVTDPLAGSISDSLKHRWGRRHPFMYASALPLGITFALVFSPPQGLGEMGLFSWLTAFTVLTRGAMTLYHVPHLALGAELTDDYAERTVVVAYRTFFQLFGAALLFLVTGEVFFRATAEFENGQMNPAAYPQIGLIFGAAMLVTILASGLGTHSRIPFLRKPPEKSEPFTLRRPAREVREALGNTSFRAFFSCLVLFFVARGTSLALGTHMGTYFWGLDGRQVMLIPLCGLGGILISTKIWGWFPPLESDAYLPTLFAIVFLASFAGGAPTVVAGSMLADIADEHELEWGRRQEGVFFGALSLAGKAASGLGSAFAGFAITLISFPLQAEPGAVAEPTVNALGYAAGPGVAVLAAAGIALMARYSLDRTRHAEIQKALRAQREGTASAPFARTG